MISVQFGPADNYSIRAFKFEDDFDNQFVVSDPDSEPLQYGNWEKQYIPIGHEIIGISCQYCEQKKYIRKLSFLFW